MAIRLAWAAVWVFVSAPLLGVWASCLIAFVVVMAVEWRRICRKFPLDRSPGD